MKVRAEITVSVGKNTCVSNKLYLFERFHFFSHTPVAGHRLMINQLYCLYLTGKIRKVLTTTFKLFSCNRVDRLFGYSRLCVGSVQNHCVVLQCYLSKSSNTGLNISLANGKHPSVKI